ncbi:MAG: hypothetical protein HRU76_08810 [Phycisphaeraceae bacterium]|nr:hypothetical protein [Phycisphaerales bacterium]QOJ17675.1 MAG: hypothetical protein HRU76_08810 [Phycisphaeraceae bacterium]
MRILPLFLIQGVQSSMSSPVSITLEPEARTWAQAAGAWHDAIALRDDLVFQGRPLAAWRTQTRRELGLPEQAVIIATGHQAAIWHPGILVKYIAADRLVRTIRREAIALDVIVDQDVNDVAAIEAPVRPGAGRLAARRVALLPEAAGDDSRPVESRAASQPLPLPAGVAWALPSVEAGLGRTREALALQAGASNAAMQFAGAAAELRSPWVGAMPRVFASGLPRSSFSQALVSAMLLDPRGCAGTYNAAVAEASDAGLTMLEVTGSSVELPLWRLDEAGRRTPVFAHELESVDPAWLRPRALTMTAIIRLAVADLFIHGRGGFIYDRVMERWINAWLGLPAAPMTLATADVRLPLPTATDQGVAEAIASYRRVWHDPPLADAVEEKSPSRDREGAVDGPSISPAKRALLDRVYAAPRRSPARRAAFDAYQRWLRQARAARPEVIDAARRSIDLAIADRAEREIAIRRDWPFPLYPREVLDELARAVEHAIDRAGESGVVGVRSLPVASHSTETISSRSTFG